MNNSESTENSIYGPAGEAKLRSFVEQVTGGRVVTMERQIRWRPAWFAQVERDGKQFRVHVRGDRLSDVMPFPELRREAEIIDALHTHGIPVPRIYGVSEDPPAIVMEALVGTRDVSQAASDAERSEIAMQYIVAVAAMHKLPAEVFVERGIGLPVGETEIALAGINAYLPLYQRTKCKPDPLIEFALRWLRRNVPRGRNEARLVQFDSGQFLFENGRMTGLYDFEFAMIADPLADLATMRMRESNESLGEDMRILCRHYEREIGHPIDHAALSYHTLAFSTAATMQFAATVAKPAPGAPHAVYLEFDLALRRTLILLLSECLGIALKDDEKPFGKSAANGALINMVEDAVAQFGNCDAAQLAQKQAALDVVEYLRCADEAAAEMQQRNLDDAIAFLGKQYDRWEDAEDAEVALEHYVVNASPEEDGVLLQLFAAQQARLLMVFGKTRIGQSAIKVFIPPTR